MQYLHVGNILVINYPYNRTNEICQIIPRLKLNHNTKDKTIVSINEHLSLLTQCLEPVLIV